MHGLQAFESKSMIEGNNQVVEAFLTRHQNDFDTEYLYNTPDRTHRGFRLSVQEAIEFLGDFRFGNLDDVARKAATIRYLQYLMKMSDGINFVYFIQMAYNAPIRHRAFNDATKSLVQGGKYFAGPSSEHDSTNYPGDQRIIGGDDSITIQLHHLYLDGAALDYAHEAYTLAINYPEQLAINYCANEANQDDDEEDDENEDA